ncbi:hypothetical protein [Peijinzhouia sedimentorum]
MKVKYIVLIILIGVSFSTFSQIKIWDKELKSIKTKGVVSRLEEPTRVIQITFNMPNGLTERFISSPE